MRIGHGYDAHRLAEGRRLILGGVDIPYEKGLIGHSDADVLIHAVIDALLGAAVMGDIGNLFPDKDVKYKNADSVKLLEAVCVKLNQNGFRIVNIDCTVIAQDPKISPYTEQMKLNIARALQAEMNCVSVKATTEEGMGFTGTHEGICAHAVCLIE